jgi:hypothetical protein
MGWAIHLLCLCVGYPSTVSVEVWGCGVMWGGGRMVGGDYLTWIWPKIHFR